MPTYLETAVFLGRARGGGFHSFLFYVSWFLQEACVYVYHIYK